jgi:hypothetical protein
MPESITINFDVRRAAEARSPSSILARVFWFSHIQIKMWLLSGIISSCASHSKSCTSNGTRFLRLLKRHFTDLTLMSGYLKPTPSDFYAEDDGEKMCGANKVQWTSSIKAKVNGPDDIIMWSGLQLPSVNDLFNTVSGWWGEPA